MENSSTADLAAAREIIENALPNESDRASALLRLTRSIDYFDQLSENSTSVTLFHDGFRFNVGKVEALMVRGSKIHLLVSADAEEPRHRNLGLTPTPYTSIKGPQGSFDNTVSAYRVLAETLDPLHEAYLRDAATRRDGSPIEGSPHLGSHSAALVEYARQYLATSQQREWTEGDAYSVVQTRYERDPEARAACLSHHGHRCVICEFDFDAFYGGELARGYIQVHHIDPISNGQRMTNAVTDLIPVCPNCHAMLHRDRGVPMTPDTLKASIRKNGTSPSVGHPNAATRTGSRPSPG